MPRTKWGDWFRFKDGWGADLHMDDRICPDGAQRKCQLLQDVESSMRLESAQNQVSMAQMPPLRVVDIRSTWDRPEIFVSCLGGPFVGLFGSVCTYSNLISL